VETLDSADWTVIPDDRQTRIDTIGGTEIQDFGHNVEGDTFSCKATLSAAGAAVVANYWHNREHVTIRDTGGEELQNMRVVIKKHGRVTRFEREYFWAEFEFWRK